MEQIQTVGDLQRLLSRFDPELPILLSNPILKTYSKIPIGPHYEYRVVHAPVTGVPPDKPHIDEFIDADVNEPGSFNAIIL